MTNQLLEITGYEDGPGDGSALDALVSFYRAFNTRDLAGLSINWLDGMRPSMDNPIGGIRRGWASIREGYEKLFHGPAEVKVTFHDVTSEGGADWHLFVGREKGICTVAGSTIDLRIRTTRWFVKSESLWRQLHHHGSIEEPGMLASYQRAIFGKTLDVQGN